MIGKTLAHYEIVEKIGAGGMGEVYRAHDPKLGRDVALKILPAGFAADEERLQRFEREARLLASLSHPNVGSIFGVEHADGQRFLVLEIVEGEDLAERISRGRLSVDEALAVAQAIADALESAHEQGVIHRDLKPANIKVSPDGQVKVLDFGLAKALDTASDSQPDLSQSPTIMASSPTVAGVILGTAGYMSPEQARGQTVDRRADIWAFGVTLYEMLTGDQMFVGDTVSDTLAAVLRADIDLDQLPKDVPASIRRLLERCLDRDPKQRLRDIGEARIVIERVRRGDVEEPSLAAAAAPAAPNRALTFVPWVLLIGALAVIAFLVINRGTQSDGVIRAYIPPPKGSSYNLTPAHPGPVAISPDGTKITFAAVGNGELMLWVREIDEVAPRPLPGTTAAGYPFWSPDGKSIGFFADGKLRRVEASGGPPLTICDASNGKGGTWNADGTIVFAPVASAGIHMVRAAGGESVEIVKLRREDKENSNRFPQFLPDGEHFLYFARTREETHRVRVASLDGTVNKEVLRGPAQARYANGHLLFLREHTLMAQGFDLSALEVTGEASPVADGVRLVSAIPLAVFSVSQTGDLVYMTGAATEGSMLRWLDREGVVTGSTGDLGVFGDFQLSPDGKQVCIEVFE
ncbi:MAG: protein kinase, partial [Candidatus Krumholzibacteria bacterium]